MTKKNKHLTWWIFTLSSFLIFVVLQIPAAWLISKFYKNNTVLQNVSGNIWQGQADWHQGSVKGSLNWKIRPLDLLLLRLGAEVDVHSGRTQLQAVVAYGFSQRWSVSGLTGEIAPETLKRIADWQWPSNPIQLQDVQFKYQKEQGFQQVDGTVQWGGGELVYTFAQRQEQMNIPSLKGQLSDRDQVLTVDVRDQRDQKMLNLLLDKNLMLDVQITQRMLMNVPSYQGKAGLDTYVVSSRQPLLKGGM
jgi:general secretion pathway protein N